METIKIGDRQVFIFEGGLVEVEGRKALSAMEKRYLDHYMWSRFGAEAVDEGRSISKAITGMNI